MPHVGHDHSHAAIQGRRAPQLRASWLRDSAARRLGMASAAIALLWAAVFWALQ